MNRKLRQPNSPPTNPARPSPAKSPTARRQSGGTCPAYPLDATHHHAPRGIHADAQPRFAPLPPQLSRMSLAHAAGTDGLKAILRTRTPSTMSRAPRRYEPQATPTELAANESRPTQPGQGANGTTKVRWDLSRLPAGRHPPPHAQGNPIRRPTKFLANPAPCGLPPQRGRMA